MKLHLGCGRTILEGWVNLDWIPAPGVDAVVDLDEPDLLLPWDPDTFEEFLASHLIEHIRDPLSLMQELHRVAKPGAKITFEVPYGSSDDAWEDPTHVRPYFLNSFSYFGQPNYWKADYGYRGDWSVQQIRLLIDERFRPATQDQRALERVMELVKTERNVVKVMQADLFAIKPIRPADKDLRDAPSVQLSFG